jgi:hypothetical protein
VRGSFAPPKPWHGAIGLDCLLLHKSAKTSSCKPISANGCFRA